jgi:hypothetical protein
VAVVHLIYTPVHLIYTPDYKTEKIDLSDSRIYRDLTKPIGREDGLLLLQL